MVLFVVGTRPDLIKMAPLIKAFEGEGKVVHTGQHYSPELDSDLCEELGVRIDIRLDTRQLHATPSLHEYVFQMSKVLQEMGKGTVAVYGDTLSALGAAVAAKACGWKVAHIEAGLRSFDLAMPEEMARLTIDSLSDRLYAPLPRHRDQLLVEGVPEGKIKVSGNLVVSALVHTLGKGKPETFDRDYGTRVGKFAVLTLHRPENTDYPHIFKAIIDAVGVILAPSDADRVIFFCHPRTRQRINELIDVFSWGNRLIISPPVSHAEMVTAMRESAFVMTDSGGMQEESAILNKKCLTFRKSTERQETLESGHNVLVSPYTHTLSEMVIQSIYHLSKPARGAVHYGVAAAEVIAADLTKFNQGL